MTQAGWKMHATMSQNNFDMATLILDKGDSQTKCVLREKGHFIMLKWVTSKRIYRNMKFVCT